jgi:hypothetical protein
MPPATRRAVRDATSVLTATPVEAALIIACALTDPMDLLRLARACRRFAIKCIAAPAAHRTTAASGGTAAAAQQAEMWSIAEEAARRWIANCPDQERGWVPRRGRESWLGLMWEVESLRRGAVFGRSHADITLAEGGSLATKRVYGQGHSRAAASNALMRAGRHYALFTLVGDVDASSSVMFFGAIRPGWDVEGRTSAAHEDGHCFYYAHTGCHFPGRHDWEGMQPAHDEGDRIGMLLDLDQGTMTVFKNDERLGVMATGLSGEYSWAALMHVEGDSVCIEVAEVPTSPMHSS